MGYGSGIAMSCGAGHRCRSDLVSLWLWHRLAATAPIRPLAWEPPYASGAALEKTKRQTNKQTNPEKNEKKEVPNTVFTVPKPRFELQLCQLLSQLCDPGQSPSL